MKAINDKNLTNLLSLSRIDTRTENLRYLLWSHRELTRDEWPTRLADWLRCSETRAEKLLEGRELLTSDEQQRLVEIHDHLFTEQDLQFSRLIELNNVAVLVENLRFLVRDISKVRQVELADSLEIDAVTLSRWVNDGQTPRKSSLQRVVRYFKLPTGTDLMHDVLFLEPSPSSEMEKRRWLKDRIDKLPSDVLNDTFKALRRLLQDR